MNFELDEELRQYRDSVIAFAQKELNDDVVTRDAEVAFSREGWRKCADFGIQGLPVPLKYGGQGASASTIIVAMEALGYGCRDAGLIFSMNAQMWGCTTPLLRAGSEEQKRRYLPALCRGSIIGAHAMTEPGSGSDAFALSTSATRSGDSYMLNGSKTFVSNAPVADLFVTFATIDRSLGFAGLCAFLVDRDAPGLVIGKPLAKMGLRTSPMSEVVFEGCRIPATALLGREGGGMALFATAMDWERSCILAGALGTMQRQLERSLDYARDRKQFGQPIGKFQAVSHRLVDMKLRLETSRLLLQRLGWLMDRGKATPLDSALAKLHVSESFARSSLDALATFGGYGYMAEYEIEREVRDALGSRIYSGTSDIQKNIAAAFLGL